MNRSHFLALSVLCILALPACGGGGGGADGAVADGAVADGRVTDSATADDTGARPGDSGMRDGSDDSGPADSGPADSGPPESCSMEGAMRTAPCGMCGLAQERCEGGVWVQGTCLSEGVCAPGAVETEVLAMCAERARICNDSCTWLGWSDTVAAHGECMTGDRRAVTGTCSGGERQIQLCDDACMWADEGACTAPCSDLRTAPLDSEEVCVPEGMFFRGDSSLSAMGGGTVFLDGSGPRREVFVSSYAIDRFPVTNRRYRECRTAGACSGLLGSDGQGALANDSRLDWPVVGVTWFQARDFCEWDGRRLPTNAEWEKAMRGPSPRTNTYVYGDAIRCDYFPVLGCPAGTPAANWERSINQYPMARSFYGLEDMMNNGGEWVSDWIGLGDYFATDDLVDPQGPPTGTAKIMRGAGVNAPELLAPVFTNVAERSSRVPNDMVPAPLFLDPPQAAPVIRCARDAFVSGATP